nr:hypothetical protein [Candidatus Sigynarchaeota archaeon]
MMTSERSTGPLSGLLPVKYMPKSLSEITGHEDIVERLESMVATKKVSHLLIAGADGCGKLTLAKCLARDLFQSEYASSVNVVHVANPLTQEERKQAESESRISTTRIGSVAGQTFIMPKFIQARIKPVVELRAMNELGFKVLIVTDFDMLGQDQQGFRRLMETYGTNCRFILTTTQVSSVIDPIASRCQVLLVSPVTRGQFFKELSRIGTIEQFKVTYTFVNSLYYVTKGNIGKALGIIQIMVLRELDLTEDNLFEIARDLESKEMLKFLESCINANFMQARELYYAVKNKNAFNLPQFLESFRKAVLHAPVSQLIKACVLDSIGEVDARATTQASDDVHVASLIFKIATSIAEKSA